MLRLLDRSKSLRTAATLSLRPSLEGLEDRVVPAAPHLGPAILAPMVSNSHASVLPLSITGVTAQNGALVAQGLLGSLPFTTPLTVTSAAASTPATPILNLHIAPIHLNLLGLEVNTSEICLNIQAQPGPGNLLGNLLSSVSNLLNQGTPLSTILSSLTSTELSTLTGGLTSILNGAARRLTAPSASQTPAPSTPGVTNILNLSLGPVNLNLLGLQVGLDNCSGGPITVNVSALAGPGNLLGNLLTGVANLLDQTPLPTRAVDTALTRIVDDLFTIL